MKLPFMLKFPSGEETHFIEKLWNMQIKMDIDSCLMFDEYLDKANKCGIWISPFNYIPKLHTIRNHSDRFKVGQFVQPFVWTEKPYRSKQFDFMPPIEIVSKQRIEIGWQSIWVDGRFLEWFEVKQLAVNDGFEDTYHFFQYFNKPVENMEIRHFTNLKY